MSSKPATEARRGARTRTWSAALATGAFMVGLAACGSGSSHPSTARAGGGANGGGGGAGTSGAAGSRGGCSDPHPSNLALTFAAIVCVEKKTAVAQQDGSTELELRVKITDKDPNAINVTSTDFKVLDAAGHDVPAEAGNPNGRTGAGDCVYQSVTDDGWPVSPGKSFAVPGSLCFNLAPGEVARQLVWQSDVAVALG